MLQTVVLWQRINFPVQTASNQPARVRTSRRAFSYLLLKVSESNAFFFACTRVKEMLSCNHTSSERRRFTRSSLLNKRDTGMTYSIEQARKIYAMGLVPALDAGFNPSLALEIIQNAAQAEREAKAEARKLSLHIGMVVSDGRLGTIIAIEGNRVQLQGYLAKRSAHIGDLHDWQHEAA